MSVSNKTRFEVQEILKANVLSGITTLGLPTANIVVMEGDQIPPTAKKDYVSFRLVSAKRAGWPKITYGTVTSNFVRTEEFVELQEWEFKCVRRIPETATSSFMTDQEYADSLKTWFNGMGNEQFRRHGISNFIVEDNQLGKTKDDSNLNLKPGEFRVTIMVPKKVIYRHNEVEVVQPNIKPV